MNFVENNGKKVAAILCVASCFPVVATIYAMETEPGWHGDKYLNANKTVAKGWKNVDSKMYYFDEDGTVNEEKTQNGVVASVSTSIASDVKNTVMDSAKQVVDAENERIDEEAATQEVAVEEASVETADVTVVITEDETTVLADTAQSAESEVATLSTETEEAAPVAETVEVEAPATEAVADTQVDTAVETQSEEAAPVAVAQETTSTESTDTQSQAQTTTNATTQQSTESTNTSTNTSTSSAQTTSTATTTTTTSSSANVNGVNNAAIANAAMGLVDTTDGMQCTEVVATALAQAGYDGTVYSPEQYLAMGTVVSADQAVAGNLIYYANGGAGASHIAIYEGNGMAVQGNFDSQTVYYSANLPYGTDPVYIQYNG